MNFTEDLVSSLNKEFGTGDPEKVLKWASQNLGESIIATSSFQTQSVPLLHLISLHFPALEICFLDTGFHFQETYHFVSELREKLSLNILTLRPELNAKKFVKKYGKVYESDPQKCCYLNKVEPLREALVRRTGWISGVRRDQTQVRQSHEVFSLQADGKLKICPILNWTQAMIDNYISDFGLPKHPLFSKGYRSIGCQPCTVAWDGSQDLRSGRWKGSAKTECGLHNYYKKNK